MTTEILCALITMAGTVISATIAWFVSRSTTSKEIERMKLSWQREDVVTSDDDFADMASEVGKRISEVKDGYALQIHDAVAKVVAVRSKESGELALALDELYNALMGGTISKIDSALTAVIDQKRKAKSHQNSTN